MVESGFTMAPPIRCLSFSSDAAGFAKWSRKDEKVGVGCVGFGLEGELIFAMQMFWPKELKEAETGVGEVLVTKRYYSSSSVCCCHF
jgi:hypothetical protein